MRPAEWLNKGLCTVASPGEVLGAAVVLGIVFIFIVPLPTWLVDVLIVVNSKSAGNEENAKGLGR